MVGTHNLTKIHLCSVYSFTKKTETQTLGHFPYWYSKTLHKRRQTERPGM